MKKQGQDGKKEILDMFTEKLSADQKAVAKEESKDDPAIAGV